jgi:integrase
MPPKIDRSETAGLFRRGSSWYLRYTPAPGQKQIKVALGVRDYVAAIVRAQEIRSGPAPAQERGDWPREVETYLRSERSTGRLRKASVIATRDALRGFQKWSGVKKAGSVTRTLVEDWQKHLVYKRKVRPSTVNTYIARLSAFLGFCVEQNMIPENPAEGVKGLRVEHTPRALAVPPDVFNEVIESTEDEEMKFVLLCGFHMGLRKNEIVSSRPAWFNLIKGQVEVPGAEIVPMPRVGRFAAQQYHFNSKNGQARRIPLSPAAARFLPGFLEKRKDQTFCIGDDSRGKRYRYDPRVPFEKLMKKAGLESVTMHTMRHSYATALAASGKVQTHQLSKWVGDHIVTVQKHYYHDDPSPLDLAGVLGD